MTKAIESMKQHRKILSWMMIMTRSLSTRSSWSENLLGEIYKWIFKFYQSDFNWFCGWEKVWDKLG